MNFKDLQTTLGIAKGANVAVNMIGLHGIGKTQGLRQYAKDNKLEVINFRLGQISDTVDIAGLNYPVKGESSEVVLKKLLPEIIQGTRKGKGILFFDELNRCHPDLIQAVFQLVEERALNNFKMGKGWQVVVAMNPGTSDYVTIDFADKAFNSRMLHVKVEPTQDEFLDYAKANEMDDDIHSFLSVNREYIEQDCEEFSLDEFVGPDRRKWMDKFGSMYKVMKKMKLNTDSDLLLEIGRGFVGTELAAAFVRHVEDRNSTIDPEDILFRFEKIEKRINPENLDVINHALGKLSELLESDVKYRTDDTLGNLRKFLIAIPADLCYEYVEKLSHNQAVYMEDLKKQKVTEIMGNKLDEAVELDVNNGALSRQILDNESMIEHYMEITQGGTVRLKAEDREEVKDTEITTEE